MVIYKLIFVSRKAQYKDFYRNTIEILQGFLG